MPEAEAIERNPLEKYAKSAPSAFMREVAAIALRRGLNQQGLAEHFGTEPANIMRHFEAYSPQQKTIQKYAKLLEMPPLYVKLLQQVRLSDEERHDAWQLLDKQLKYSVHDLGEDTIEAVRDRFEELDFSTRGALLESFQLEELRRLAYYPAGWLSEWRSVSPALREFVKKILGRDLPQLKPVSDPTERFLLDLWILLTEKNILTFKEAQHLLNTARYMLTTRGVDLEAMEIRLAEDKLYYGSMVTEADRMVGTLVKVPKKGDGKKRDAK